MHSDHSAGPKKSSKNNSRKSREQMNKVARGIALHEYSQQT